MFYCPLIYSYLLRCRITDDWDNVKLAFDLEVVQLQKMAVVGVYRKRVKGDTWSYKSVCEDVLRSARL